MMAVVHFLMMVCGLLIYACGKPNPEVNSDSVAHKEEWRLVWNDEFDYTGLPDPAKWDYEEGFVRNEEKQYYTRARQENSYVNNGVLTITGRREQYPNAAYLPGSADWKRKGEHASYTSACLITKGKVSWTYGKIEVKAKLPEGRGVWPAIWMLGDNIGEVGWPKCGEIDIMEHVGFESGNIHTNVHYERQSDGQYDTKMSTTAVSSVQSEFHVYRMEWDKKEINLFIDDNLVNTFAIDLAGQTFHKPQYLLLNLALGGAWGGAIDDNIFPQSYVIDYVRVYQKVK